MPRVQEVSYDLPGIDDGLARSVGNARRLPRCGCSASTSTGSRCHHHVTTSSRTGMPSWRSAVKRRSKSGCKSGVHTGARRRATREGCCASPRVKGRSTDGYLWAAVNSERQLRSAAQRQHAAERVGVEGQRRVHSARTKEATASARSGREGENRARARATTNMSLYEEAQHDMRASTARAPTASKYIASVAQRPSLNGTHRRRAHCGRQRRRWCSCKRP